MTANDRKPDLRRVSDEYPLPTERDDSDAAVTAMAGGSMASIPSSNRWPRSSRASWQVLKRVSRGQKLAKLRIRRRQLLEGSLLALLHRLMATAEDFADLSIGHLGA